MLDTTALLDGLVLAAVLLTIIASAVHFNSVQPRERCSGQSYSQLAAKLLTLFGVTLPGLPWNAGALMLYRHGLKNVGYALFALAYPVNGALVVGLINKYRAGTDDGYHNEGHEWQVAVLSYAMGMMVLALAALVARSRARRRGADEDEAEAGMHAAVLRAFDVRAKSAGHSDRWTYPLLALLAAQAGYFVAAYFFGDHAQLVCDRAPAGRACASPYLLPLLQGGERLCCAAVQRHFDLSEFLAAFGGNVIAGYGAVKYTAKLLLVGDATVRLRRHNTLLPRLNPSSSAARGQLRARSVSSALASRGAEDRTAKLSVPLTSNPGVSSSPQSESRGSHFRGTSRSSHSSASGAAAAPGPAPAPAPAPAPGNAGGTIGGT